MQKGKGAMDRVPLLFRRIQRARRQCGLTPSALARALGVAPSAVAQWERDGGTQPSLQHVIALAELADVSLDWLILGRINSLGSEREETAVDPSYIARDELEEHALRGLRACTPSCRAVVSSLIDLLAGPASRRHVKDRS